MVRILLSVLLTLLTAGAARADLTVSILPGTDADVATHPRGHVLAVLREGGTRVDVLLNGTERLWSETLPIGTRMVWVRVAANPAGQTAVVGQSGRDAALFVTPGRTVTLAPVAWGVHPVAIEWGGGDWRIVNSTRDQLVTYAGVREVSRAPWATSSQGIRVLTPFLRGDDSMCKTLAPGRTVCKFTPRGDWAAGQAAPVDRFVLVNRRTQQAYTLFRGFVEEPHYIQDGTTHVGVALGGGGIVYARLTAPFPAADGPWTSAATPPPVVTPPPAAEIPDHKAVVVAARAKYDALRGRERAYHIVNQVAWDLRAEGAGLFYKTGEASFNERSSDVIIFKPGGETFDILGDAEGRAEPAWGRTKPTGLGDVKKWRAPVAPSGTPPPVDPPPPPPVEPPAPNPVDTVCGSAVDFAALTAHFTAVHTKIDALLALLRSYEGPIAQAAHESLQAATRTAEIRALLPATHPVYVGRVLGMPVTLRPQ